MGNIQLDSEEAAFISGAGINAEHLDTIAAVPQLRRQVGMVCWFSGVVILLLVGGAYSLHLKSVEADQKVKALEVERELLESKVNPSPEKIAAMIQDLREMADPNLRDKAGRSHIFLACKAGRLDKAIAWHKLGCNWNTPRNAGVFNNSGRNFDRTGKFGMTHASPLMTAAIHRHWHIVEYALDNSRSEIEWDYRDLHGKGLIDVLERAIDAGEKDPALLRCIEKFPNL
jgi:hypothetical protein